MIFLKKPLYYGLSPRIRFEILHHTLLFFSLAFRRGFCPGNGPVAAGFEFWFHRFLYLFQNYVFLNNKKTTNWVRWMSQRTAG